MTQGVTNRNGYLNIVAHYEDCLAKHGDSHLGVDWPNKEDALKRYRVMLEIMGPAAPEKQIKLLDFGCGASHLYEYMLNRGLKNIEYAGLDLSPMFVRLSQGKFPAIKYYCLDVLDGKERLPEFDYVVMNGVFTEKRELTNAQMFAYFKRLVTRVFDSTRRGVAFNVMSKHVDWEREDLFHLPLDKLADFLTKKLSRDYVIRNDYGLYEYTTYVYK